MKLIYTQLSKQCAVKISNKLLFTQSESEFDANQKTYLIYQVKYQTHIDCLNLPYKINNNKNVLVKRNVFEKTIRI